MSNRFFPAFLPLIAVGLLYSANALVERKPLGESPGQLSFIGDAGSPNIFTVENWRFTQIALPDGDPTRIEAEIDIDISSIRCDWQELQESIKTKKDYFHLRRYPSARVVIKGARALADGSYQTDAMLTLKKNTAPVRLAFTISKTPPYRVVGSGLIQRSAFGFNGDGPKEEVPISFDAVLPVK